MRVKPPRERDARDSQVLFVHWGRRNLPAHTYIHPLPTTARGVYSGLRGYHEAPATLLWGPDHEGCRTLLIGCRTDFSPRVRLFAYVAQLALRHPSFLPLPLVTFRTFKKPRSVIPHSRPSRPTRRRTDAADAPATDATSLQEPRDERILIRSDIMLLPRLRSSSQISSSRVIW